MEIDQGQLFSGGILSAWELREASEPTAFPRGYLMLTDQSQLPSFPDTRRDSSKPKRQLLMYSSAKGRGISSTAGSYFRSPTITSRPYPPTVNC